MKRKQWYLMGASLLGLAAVGAIGAVNPVAETHFAPMVKEQVNTAIEGTINYDSMHIKWNGDVVFTNVVVKDQANHLVAAVPEMDVAMKLTSLPSMLLSGASGAELIGSVNLETPEIHVWQLPDGTWNVTHLIQSGDDSSRKKFDGDINFHNADAVVRLKDGNVHRLQQASGTVELNTESLTKGAATGILDGHTLTVNGSVDMNKTDRFELFIQADAVDISGVMNLVSLRDDDVVIKKGLLRDTKVNIKGNDGQYSMSGNLSFDSVDGTYRMNNTVYSVTDGAGRIFFQDKKILIAHSDWKVNAQPIRLNGLIDIGETGEQLNLTATGQGIDVGALTNNRLMGTVGGRVHIGGTGAIPYIQADLDSSGIGYDGYHIDRAHANVVYHDGNVKVNGFSAYMGNGSIGGNGVYKMSDGSFGISLKAHDADIASVTEQLGTPATGTVSGTLFINGSDNRISDMEGALTGKDISVRGVTVDTAQVNFTRQGQRSQAVLTGRMGDGVLSGYGTLEGGNIAMNLSARDIPASRFNNLLSGTLEGTLTGEAEVNGSLHNPQVNGHVASDEILYNGARFNNIYSDFNVGDHVLTLTRTYIGDGDGGYEVQGTVNLNDDSLALTATAKTVRVENLLRPFTDIPITGWVESTNEIRGTLHNPLITGETRLWDGSAYGKLISQAQARYTVQNQVLNLSEFVLQGYGATVKAYGTASVDALDIRLAGDNIDMERLLTNTDVDIHGFVSGRGHLYGSLENPQFNGSLGSERIVLNQTAMLNVWGELYADKHVVNLQNLSFDEEGGGHYIAKGGMSLDGERRLFGSLQVKDGSVSNLLKLTGKPIDKLDGSLNGNVELGGTASNPSVAVTGTINDVMIDKRIVGDASVDACLANRKFTVNTLRLPVSDGVIAMGGTMDLDGAADMQLAIRNVDITPFLPLLGDSVNATGSVTGVMNVTGETHNPKVELSASLANGSYNGITIDQGFILATMNDKVIQIQRIQGAKGDYKLSAYGKVPLAALYTSGYLPAGDDKSMDVTVDFNEADMAVIPLITPRVQKADGELRGVVHVTGTLDQPEAYGTVSVRNGLLKLKDLDNDISAIDADLIFSGQQGDFQSRIAMGKGTAGISGKVNWEGHRLTNYRMAAQLDNLDIQNEYVKGPINGELYIAERDGMPTLVGHIDLENDRFKIPLSFESSESTADLGMDVTVHAGNRVRLYDRTLYDMFIEGDVHFGGSVLYPQASGQFNVRSGTFKYLSHVFTITKGNAQFVNGSYLPILTLDAETNVGSYNIMLGVKGTVDRMDLSLTSDPRLPRNQIISMLTFGRGTPTNSSTITNEDANAVAVAGVQMFAFGYVQDALQNTLGLDRINITTGSIDPDEPTNKETAGNYNIEIGKYVLPKVMLIYSQGINNKQNKYGVEYSVRRNLKFTGWHTSQGNNYLGGRWTREF